MKVRFENSNNPILSFTEKEIPPSMSVGVRVMRTPRAKAGFRDFYGFVNFYLNRSELWVWKVRHESETDTRARACRSANDTDADDDLFDP